MKKQPGGWECGYILMLILQQVAMKLAGVVVTLRDKDDKLASFAKYFKHTPKLVKKVRSKLADQI